MADRSPGNNEIGVLQKQLRDQIRRLDEIERALDATLARMDAVEDRVAKKVRA